MDRAGKHPQPILRAFLRAVLAEIWWKRQVRHLKRKTKIYDKFKIDRDEHLENFKGKYLKIKGTYAKMQLPEIKKRHVCKFEWCESTHGYRCAQCEKEKP